MKLNETAASDVVITTYHTLLAEARKGKSQTGPLLSQTWKRVVLDEGTLTSLQMWRRKTELTWLAHDIRDHSGALCQAVCALQTRSRWAVTGTPIQNGIMDIASLFQFLRVHPYTSARAFQGMATSLQKRFPTKEATERLRRLVKCIMLRRSITTIKLPERQDLMRRLDLNDDEAEIYNELKRRSLTQCLPEHGSPQTTLTALQMINQLRMVCNLGRLHQSHKHLALECQQLSHQSLVVEILLICKNQEPSEFQSKASRI